MSKGYTLHIGLNKVDQSHYGELVELRAAVNDAMVWQNFAIARGFEKSIPLLDDQATVAAVQGQLTKMAEKMIEGDILLLTYSGHGGEIPNEKPMGFDNERMDQTWCLYDRQFLDDELFEAFKSFKKGTRIVVVSDSCHSGTITRVIEDNNHISLDKCLLDGLSQSFTSRGSISKKLSDKAKNRSLKKAEVQYNEIHEKFKYKRQAEGVKASVKLLAAAQDDEVTYDGTKNGLFTENLLNILDAKDFRDATGETLIDQIRSTYYYPCANFFEYGSIMPDFDSASPFAINIAGQRITGYRDPKIPASISRKPLAKRKGTWDTMAGKIATQLLVEFPSSLDLNVMGGEHIKIISEQNGGETRSIWLEIPNLPQEKAWSAAHALKLQLIEKSGNDQITVEPIISVNPGQNEAVAREADVDNPDYITDWPPSENEAKIGWHLDDEHSQLSKAYQFVVGSNQDAHIRIAHLDTGYRPGHIALPINLKTDLARSFVRNEQSNQAIDPPESGQDGHGLGTLTILAGSDVKKVDTFNEYEGKIGGVPFAEIIPIRISDSVIILDQKNFCDAIDYAIDNQCEVVSMSMAGKPSIRMAKAVNRAYEAGIVMVTAASNCWYKGPGAILPKCVLYPAAFERVIAATGALYNHKPYDKDFLKQIERMNIGTEYMQGSWGPASRMKYALAAYTPNIPWASSKYTFLKSGGGTSSATPQVAATAALWIAHHRKELEDKGYYDTNNKWKKVEAVRTALYQSAAKEDVFGDWKKYYGNGIIRAFDALEIGVADIEESDKAPKADTSLFGILETFGAFFQNRAIFRGSAPTDSDLSFELLDLLQTDPQFYDTFSKLDLNDAGDIAALLGNAEFREKVRQSPWASEYLKLVFNN